MERVIAAGVNHIDVAPSYGLAEERLGPWMARDRDRFFLGCKTMGRTKAGAAAELRRSLALLRTDRFDLYQLHAVTSLAELDEATRTGGALEAMLEGLPQLRLMFPRFRGVSSPDFMRLPMGRCASSRTQRGQHPQSAVPALAVVEDLQVLEDRVR